MTDSKSTRNKHMTLDDREEIEQCLDKGMTFKAIARRVRKDPTTISKEVKKHLIVVKPGDSSRKTDQNAIEKGLCPRLLKAPFVCNPCDKRRGYCSFRKQFYRAKNAHSECYGVRNIRIAIIQHKPQVILQFLRFIRHRQSRVGCE